MAAIVYASDVVPAPGQGGQIIADRHLRHLAALGHTITIVSPAGRTPATGPWQHVAVPARRWWWPPFRPRNPVFTAIRSWALRRELAALGMTRADAVATICWGPASWLAASLAAHWQCPLVAIVHDWWGEVGDTNDEWIGRKVCREAAQVFAVSAEMQRQLIAECGRPVDVLYPVPGGRVGPWAAWHERYRTPVVGHVGALHAYHEEFLATIAQLLAPAGGRLAIVCAADNPVAARLTARAKNIVRQDLFPENTGALRWVAEHASALAVMYEKGLDDQGRPPTGFPSRLVEFSQLGLPILLAAPAGNPVRAWAQQRPWQGQAGPHDRAAIAAWLGRLTRPETWTPLAAETRAAAESDFEPGRLHAQFAAAFHPTSLQPGSGKTL